MTILDARVSRAADGGPSFSLANRLQRLAWQICWFSLASWTPRTLHPWRRLLLRAFGASMGPGSDVRGSARVWLPSNLAMEANAVIGPKVNCYNQARIWLGERALVSQGAYLCAGSHDVDDPNFQLIAKPIHIGRHSWIAAEAFIGPGVTVGDYAVVGARAAAFTDIPESQIWRGNPAVYVRHRRLGLAPSGGGSK